MMNHICLLSSQEGIPLQHHIHASYSSGQLLLHQKDLSNDTLQSLLLHNTSIESYDIHSKLFHFHNETILLVKVPRAISTATATPPLSNTSSSTPSSASTLSSSTASLPWLLPSLPTGYEYQLYYYVNAEKVRMQFNFANTQHPNWKEAISKGITYLHQQRWNVSQSLHHSMPHIVYLQQEFLHFIPGEDVILLSVE